MTSNPKSATPTETITRCPWPGIEDPEYASYHDEEWGVPKTADRDLFEKLCLEGFQAGLSWLTILKKRDNFRRAFQAFEPERIARFTDADIARLMGDTGIVRNRAKIEATITNARAYLALAETQSLSHFIWRHLDGRPIIHARLTSADVPAKTPLSTEISKALKEAGFRFVGSTTVYAFMQASGMVNDHLITCPRRHACAHLQRSLSLET